MHLDNALDAMCNTIEKKAPTAVIASTSSVKNNTQKIRLNTQASKVTKPVEIDSIESEGDDTELKLATNALEIKDKMLQDLKYELKAKNELLKKKDINLEADTR